MQVYVDELVVLDNHCARLQQLVLTLTETKALLLALGLRLPGRTTRIRSAQRGGRAVGVDQHLIAEGRVSLRVAFERLPVNALGNVQFLRDLSVGATQYDRFGLPSANSTSARAADRGLCAAPVRRANSGAPAATQAS